MRYLLMLVALLSASCGGPDSVRLRLERACYKNAVQCRDGWFDLTQKIKSLQAEGKLGAEGFNLPSENTQRLINNSLNDWDNALKQEEEEVKKHG